MSAGHAIVGAPPLCRCALAHNLVAQLAKLEPLASLARGPYRMFYRGKVRQLDSVRHVMGVGAVASYIDTPVHRRTSKHH